MTKVVILKICTSRLIKLTFLKLKTKKKVFKTAGEKTLIPKEEKQFKGQKISHMKLQRPEGSGATFLKC